MIVTSKNRTIPLSIPVGFFFLGEGFLLAFALLFASTRRPSPSPGIP